MSPSFRRTLLEELVFSAAVFLFVYFRIRTHLIYYLPETWFYGSPAAIAGMLDIYQGWSHAAGRFYPGSLCDGLGALLSHYYAVPWLGAALLAGAAWLLSFLTGRVMRYTAAGSIPWLRFLPPLVLLALVQRYENMLGSALSLSAALGGAAWYGKAFVTESRTRTVRIVLFFAFSAAVVFLSNALPVFLLLCAASMAFAGRAHCAAAAAAGGIAVSLPWPAEVLSPIIADGRVDPGTLFFYGSAPAAVLAAAVFQRASRFAPLRIGTSVHTNKGRLLLSLTALAAAGGIIVLTDDPCARNHARLNYYLYTEQWRKLLLEAEKRPAERFAPAYSHIVNRALFHEGRLLEDMLAFPQDVRGLLMNDPGARDNRSLFRRWVWSGWTLYELGLINNAENVAYEAVARTSHFPEGLRLLAFIHMVKGMPEAARTFLRALRKDFVYRSEADRCLRRIREDTTMASLPEIIRARTRMPLRDAVGGITLGELIERDPDNRMAFEYMMAEYLLTRNLDLIFLNMHRFASYKYPEIPKLCQEALIIRAADKGDAGFPPGFSPGYAALDRFKRFSEILGHSHGNLHDARSELSRTFGDSYFFYFLYGYSGCVR